MTRQDDMQRDERREASAPDRPDATSEHSKDAFFVRVAELAEEMIERHGKDFAMGTLVLAARFVAEGKPLSRTADDARDG